MKNLDIGYRAFEEFSKLLDDYEEIRSFVMKASAQNEQSKEHLQGTTTICKVDPEWIEKIKDLLPFVSNAILENRQFVKSEGELVPIEKVRTVGKDSVIDLAKHSNYITKRPQDTGGKVIPDKLLMPKKEDDFALYENRFLYSLLVYLSQFVEIRYEEIKKLCGKYSVKLEFGKEFEYSDGGGITIGIQMQEERFNDTCAVKRSKSADALSDIQSIISITKSLLNTSLMKTISKASLVRPPIVQTNIIRFDHNFNKSLELYQYLTSYSEKGYTVETIPVSVSPFPFRMEDTYAKLVYLTSFLSYLYSNDLKEELEKHYQDFKTQKKKEEEERILGQIRRIKNSIKASGMTSEEYIFLLEKGQKILQQKLSDKEDEEERRRLEFAKKVEELEADYRNWIQKEKVELEDGYGKQIQDLKNQLFRSEEETNNRIRQLETRFEQERQNLKNELQKEKDAFWKECQEKVEKSDKEKQLMGTAMNELKKENDFLVIEVRSLRKMNGIQEDIDITRKENFLILEKEKKAFDSFYKDAWKKTKKSIRKRILPLKEEDKRKDKKK